RRARRDAAQRVRANRHPTALALAGADQRRDALVPAQGLGRHARRGRSSQRDQPAALRRGHDVNAPRLVHVTTTDISLALLLGPQLEAFKRAGYEVIGASAPGPWVPELEAAGVEHIALQHATRAWAPHRDL